MQLTKISATLLVLASAATLIPGTNASSAPNTKIPILDQDSYLFNNMWGGSSGSQSIRSQDGHEGFDWNWGNSSSSVQGYPSIVRGWHWNTPTFTTHALPISVTSSTSCSLRSTLQYNMRASGSYDAAYDLWATTDRTLSWQTHPSLEVMIWGEHQNVHLAGAPDGTVTIAGQQWAVWRGEGAFGGPVVSFVVGSGVLHTPLNLLRFVRAAAGANAEPNLRLVGTEFGVEVTRGAGSTTVRDWVEQRSRSCN
ncbi:GH12 family glycosyl hydrolase domain-containing protein [Curtobacterium flaccumfaciens]|uniref:GH12 family glycosyl hydrolase domain-containing protein n=1 Tax=Curtobacterium flaccumfaciens TaxID=2035 RepID=UPI001E3CAB46|nr:hypothetical protein [Curtobacterium allii]MCE0459772.1 hypothetical protein [Curtobacterium allii]